MASNEGIPEVAGENSGSVAVPVSPDPEPKEKKEKKEKKPKTGSKVSPAMSTPNRIAPSPPPGVPGMSGGMSPLTPGKGKFGDGGNSFSPDASRRFAAAAYEPEVLLPIRRAPARHDLPQRARVCCFSVNWDEAYEFTAPAPNVWWKRLMARWGLVPRSFEGTLFDVVDELQRCGHISQMQSQQLYGLVRVAMGNQYKAELDMQKHLMLQTTAAVCGAVVPVIIGVQSTLENPQVKTYISYFAIFLSLLQTLAGTVSQVANYNQNAITLRMTAAEIKAEIYKYESLAGEYSAPADYQSQYPKLMNHLAEFRQKAVQAAYEGQGGKDGKDDKEAERDEAKRVSDSMLGDGLKRGV